jgi:hypothetical protein
VEHSGASVTGVSGELAEVARRRGPFLSVYLTTAQKVEHAAQLAEERWSPLRRTLSEAGAPGSELDEVQPLVAQGHLEGAAVGVVRCAGSPGFVDHGGEPLVAEIAAWGPAPVLTPSVGWRQNEPPYVAVLVDHTGADLLAATRQRPPEAESVEGRTDWPITKHRGGGWAQWRYQHRVEENWAKNERVVATEIERLVDAVHARAVLVGGDEHAVGILRSVLPERVDALVHPIPGSRAAGGAGDELGDAATRWARSAARADAAGALDALRSRLAHGRAVEGAGATFAALREARVDVLLVHDPRLEREADGGAERSAPRTAWFVLDAPQECALAAEDLEGLGLGETAEAPLVDVAVRAALVSGGSILVVPADGGPADGLGALLRWSEDGH